MCSTTLCQLWEPGPARIDAGTQAREAEMHLTYREWGISLQTGWCGIAKSNGCWHYAVDKTPFIPLPMSMPPRLSGLSYGKLGPELD